MGKAARINVIFRGGIVSDGPFSAPRQLNDQRESSQFVAVGRHAKQIRSAKRLSYRSLGCAPRGSLPCTTVPLGVFRLQKSVETGRRMNHAAPLHSCKYRWLHAPQPTLPAGKVISAFLVRRDRLVQHHGSEASCCVWPIRANSLPQIHPERRRKDARQVDPNH